MRRHTLTLVGVQNALPAQVEAAATGGACELCPQFDRSAPAARIGTSRAAQLATTEPAVPKRAATRATATRCAAAPAPTPLSEIERGAAPKTRLISQPVRSGTQIYARGADLIVIAAVSPGAEIMADGNIHVYGPLRGRALAGAAGDAEARIFCTRFEAELVSIAGRYLVSEQMPPEERGLPVQIALIDDRLTITRN